MVRRYLNVSIGLFLVVTACAQTDGQPRSSRSVSDSTLESEITYTTYEDGDGGVWVRSDCPNTDQALFGHPDGLPPKGHTLTKDEIEAMIGDDPRYRIVPRNGGVWERQAYGQIVVTQAEDFFIELTLDDPSECPDAPTFVDGVPYLYRVADE